MPIVPLNILSIFLNIFFPQYFVFFLSILYFSLSILSFFPQYFVFFSSVFCLFFLSILSFSSVFCLFFPQYFVCLFSFLLALMAATAYCFIGDPQKPVGWWQKFFKFSRFSRFKKINFSLQWPL